MLLDSQTLRHSLLLRISDSQTLRFSKLRHFIHMHTCTIGLDSQTLRLQALRLFVSQALRFSDSQILRLRHFRSTHTYTIGLDSQTLRLSDSQILRLSDCEIFSRLSDSQTFRVSDTQTLALRLSYSQTPALYKHAYVHNQIGFSGTQILRFSDCHILFKLSDC